MNEILKRDQNRITVLAGVTDDADQDIMMLRVDPITKRLLVSATGGGGGTPGGSDTQLQYNNAGAFGGLANTAYIPGTSLTIGADNNAGGNGDPLLLNAGSGQSGGYTILAGGTTATSTFSGGLATIIGGANSIAAAINATPGSIVAEGSFDDGATGATGGGVYLQGGTGADSTSSSIFNGGGIIYAAGGTGTYGGTIALSGGGYDPFGFHEEGGLVEITGGTYTSTGGITIKSKDGLAGASANVSTGDIVIQTGAPVGAGTKGKITLGGYGTGAITGTTAKFLSVNSSGNVIEVAMPIPSTLGGTGVAQASASSTLTLSGAYGLTFTMTGTTSLSLPTSGTLLAGTLTTTRIPYYNGTALADNANLTWDNTNSSLLSIGGTANNPSFAVTATAGIWSSASNIISFATGSTNRFNLDTNSVRSVTNGGGVLGRPAGTVSAPTHSFQGSTDTGMWLNSNALGFAVDGVNYINIDTPSDTVSGFKYTATAPSTITAAYNTFDLQITGAGTSAFLNRAFNVDYLAGYTGAARTTALRANNASAGTGTGITTFVGNWGFNAGATGTTTGTNIAGINIVSNGILNVATAGLATTAKNSGTNVGVIGLALNTGTSPIHVGGYFGLQNSDPTFTSAALMADNGSTTSDIFVARDNGTAVFSIQDAGKIAVYATNTAGGTTGNQTINKASGTVNIAAAGTTVTVTNSLCTTSSIVFCTVRTNDTTALIKNCVPGSGSFVINMNAAVTAETSIGFLIIN